MPLTAEEVLGQAAERVEKGWIQGAFNSPEGMCVLGAIGWAGTYREENAHAAYVALQKETGADCLMLWNDDPERDALEVATALRNAKRWL